MNNRANDRRRNNTDTRPLPTLPRNGHPIWSQGHKAVAAYCEHLDKSTAQGFNRIQAELLADLAFFPDLGGTYE